MIKILHAADLHLGSPITGRSDAQAAFLRRALEAVPGKLADICRRERCDLVLLAGDIFDGEARPSAVRALRSALAQMEVPVFIAPGNHDPMTPGSVWDAEQWSDNVTIFSICAPVRLSLPALDCDVYGGAFSGRDCPGLLEGFHADGRHKYQIGVFHGDPTQINSAYNPVTAAQVGSSGLHYLALGHIHKGGSFRAGGALCAWPGCPMGRGFDEGGEKGVIIAELGETTTARFLPLDTPRFYDLEVMVDGDPRQALSAVLPPAGNDHFYRITLTGACDGLDLRALDDSFPQFANLELRDRTHAQRDPWETADADSLEGAFFRKLQETMEGQDETTTRRIRLAAQIARQILDGQEVVLP